MYSLEIKRMRETVERERGIDSERKKERESASVREGV